MRSLWRAVGVFAVLFLALLFSSSEGVEAQDNQSKIDGAFQWLVDKVAVSWGNTEENAFSIMALKGFDSSLAEQGVQNLLQNSVGNECWPSPSCKVRDTALATIALEKMGKDTTKPKAWLLLQQKLFLEEGDWFLQYEILSGTNNGTCTAAYTFGGGNKQDTIFIKEGRKIELEQTSLCFDVLSNKPYWLNIKEPCLETEFFVSCQEPEWLANMLFNSGSTLMFFPEIKTAGTLKITSKCFPNIPGGSCDYDASMWASYALDLLEEDPQTRAFLESGADANKPLSYALLFLISAFGEIDFAEKLAAEQDAGGFWNGAERFFHTAISYLSLKNVAIGNLDLPAAKNWLLASANQNSDFSWGSDQKHRDTAAVLFGVFTRVGGGGVGVQRCESFGEPLRNICCSADKVRVGADDIDLSCANIFGTVCVAAQDCEATDAETCAGNNGICCGTPAVGATTYGNLDCGSGEICASSCGIAEEDTCSDIGGRCCEEAASGASFYSAYNKDCGFEQVCASECKAPGEGGFLKFLIWFLVILVIVGGIILAFILMRKRKGKAKDLSGIPGLPGIGGPPRAPPVFRRPPTPRGPPMMPRPTRPPARPVRPLRRTAKRGKTEEELKKTLKELEEI